MTYLLLEKATKFEFCLLQSFCGTSCVNENCSYNSFINLHLCVLPDLPDVGLRSAENIDLEELQI